MSSFVTSAVRSVAGKITRSGFETRTSRPPASTAVASDAAMAVEHAATRRFPIAGSAPAACGPTRGADRLLGGVPLRDALGRAREPGLDDHFVELLDRDLVEADEHGRIAVEVRRREEDARVVGEHRLLRDQVLDARTEDR